MAGEGFGAFVALDGNTLAIGNRPTNTLNSGRPAAFIFERAADATNWSFVTSLIPSRSGMFGLDLDGDTLALIPGDSTTIELFSRNRDGANHWGRIRQIPAPASTSRNGSPLALDGDLLAFGAASDPAVTPIRSGRVFVFERNIGGADTWGLLTTVSGSALHTSVTFATVVALDGNTLATEVKGDAYIFSNPLRAPTGLGLEVAANAVQPGGPITVTAMISGSSDTSGGATQGTPQGEVNFFLNGAPVGTAPLDAAGQARVTLPGLAQGTYALTARFAGNDRWAPCTAPPLTLYVGVAPPPAPESRTVFLPLVSR